MIETIFTFSLMFVLNTAQIPQCADSVSREGNIQACYVYETKTIYLNQEVKTYPQDFLLYHEIGHHLFKYNFQKSLFSNEEIMADQFGLFIYGKKYPYLESLQNKEREDYFTKYCNTTCEDTILSIKLPNSHFDKSFNIYN